MATPAADTDAAMALWSIAAAASMLPPPLEISLLPTRASAALLPGESRKFRIRNERMHSFFVNCANRDASVCGQLLRAEDNSIIHTVPLLKVLRVGPGFAELTCIGRGHCQLPLRPAPGGGSHSCASVYPVRQPAIELGPIGLSLPPLSWMLGLAGGRHADADPS